MAMNEMSPQRKSAYYKWRQAQQELQKGHADSAMELAHAALEDDPDFIELRVWVAQRYIAMNDPRKAGRELEEIIHIQEGHEQAWALLRKVDPPAAERLERLRDIAPDPFVAKRTAPLTDDIGSFDEFLDDDDEYEEHAARSEDDAVAADPFHSGAGRADAFSDIGGEDTPDDEGSPDDDIEAPDDDRGPHLWEFEQDRPFLEKWEAQSVVASMTAKIQELWTDPDAWETCLSDCAHADQAVHPQVFEAAHMAATQLGVQVPELMIFPERCMHPVIIKDKPPILAVPTGLIRAMSEEEMLFQIGREIGHILTGYLAQMQIVKIVTYRKARLIGDVASTLRDCLAASLKHWDEGLSPDELGRLKKLGHAWQQRCELTADRAGLLCCRSADVACAAIAKTTAKSIDEASILTVDRFLKQFEGQDVAQLAAIPVEESPSRNPAYAAYRIQMLNWWATTPEYEALA